MKRHGYSGTPTYISWRSMRDRCENPNATSFESHGGRGIRVCDRWKTFTNFLFDMGERPAGKCIERTDNDGDYEPSNCRWASMKEQDNNRRSNNVIEFLGERKTLEQWAEEIGIPSNTLWMRLYHSQWPIEKALSTPLAPNRGRFA